ncbi:30S ribosomal protein S7 [Candidatus Woesearchaeota archaeon]|nr:30S ribosomal protein S7 [Candidatus Woesearchaeota archaeon]
MANNLKAFNKWETSGIVVTDIGIKDYITVEPKIVPKTGARYVGNRFHKSKAFIVERLINKLMTTGHKSKGHFKTSYHITGKAQTAYKIVKKTFEIIEQKTKQNPVKVFVEALVNAAPREEIVTIEYGGARYPKAVECAPQRRVDIVLRLMTQGSYHKAFNSKKSIEDCLADEIINAWKMSNNSVAIAKKLEVERQADASR